jgi:hypothetical protein
MSKYTVDQFLGDARTVIDSKGLEGGLDDIRIHMERLLREPSFLEDNVDLEKHTGFTEVGYDEVTDIHVIVHGGRKGSKSQPHDHGPCSVIYGNLTNHTIMRRWRRDDTGVDEGAANLVLENEYKVHAGEASAFGRGDIHSIEFPDKTYFVRVTVGDVEKQITHTFDVGAGTVKFGQRSK